MLDSIESAIEDIKLGKCVIVVDDENRENEGDFICSAELVTPEIINFMITHGRGLVCVPLLGNRCNKLELNMMVDENTDPNKTAFTVSVDKLGDGVTTGISAKDRAKTVLALVDEKSTSSDFSKPGHIFPLKSKQGGVLRRVGHTEAAVDLSSLAGLKPAGVIVEIMNEDGSMARVPQLRKIAKRFDLKMVSIEDLVAYRMQKDSLINKNSEFDINTKYGDLNIKSFEQIDNNNTHIAITKGNWKSSDIVTVRVHKSNLDIVGFLNPKSDFESMFKIFENRDNWAIIVINKEVGGMDLELSFSDKKINDNRDFGIGAQIIHSLNIKNIELISNSDSTKIGISGYGIVINNVVGY